MCGFALSGRIRTCPSCETSHHEDCFDYLEGCARFACPGGQQIRDKLLELTRQLHLRRAVHSSSMASIGLLCLASIWQWAGDFRTAVAGILIVLLVGPAISWIRRFLLRTPPRDLSVLQELFIEVRSLPPPSSPETRASRGHPPRYRDPRSGCMWRPPRHFRVRGRPVRLPLTGDPPRPVSDLILCLQLASVALRPHGSRSTHGCPVAGPAGTRG